MPRRRFVLVVVAVVVVIVAAGVVVALGGRDNGPSDAERARTERYIRENCSRTTEEGPVIDAACAERFRDRL